MNDEREKKNNNLGTNWRVLHTSRKIPPRSFVPFSVGLGQTNIDYLVFAIWKYNDFASFFIIDFLLSNHVWEKLNESFRLQMFSNNK